MIRIEKREQEQFWRQQDSLTLVEGRNNFKKKMINQIKLFGTAVSSVNKQIIFLIIGPGFSKRMETREDKYEMDRRASERAMNGCDLGHSSRAFWGGYGYVSFVNVAIEMNDERIA